MTDVTPGIFVDDAIHAGEPVIKGTPVPVHVVVGHLAAGESAGEICREYWITEADVRAARAYRPRPAGARPQPRRPR